MILESRQALAQQRSFASTKNEEKETISYCYIPLYSYIVIINVSSYRVYNFSDSGI